LRAKFVDSSVTEVRRFPAGKLWERGSPAYRENVTALSSAACRAAAGAVVLGLLAALPRATRGATLAPPRVDLDQMRLAPEGITAPTADGGRAELTLDPALQREAARLLALARPTTGAILAVDLTTGNVLAWAGFQGGHAAPGVVASTLAPAASLFKIVTTTALLEKHVSPDRTVCIEGGSSRISAENMERPKAGHALCGPFREALGRSRNAVFAQLATRFLGPEDLRGTAARFGFGADAPLDVPASIGSLTVPDGGLAFARAAAGFVGSELSPVGAAELGTTVATKGQVLRFRIVRRAPDYVANERREFMGRAMTETTAHELARMMEVTVHTGTSQKAFTDEDGESYLGDVRAAGKTGTLQPNADEPTTSWFLGFAPSRKPRIALSVLLENGVGWRRKANEVGRDVLRCYFAARGYRGVTLPEGL
jgi:peptidoglycan glycosyltransferase